jgi:hypothetical protein
MNWRKHLGEAMAEFRKQDNVKLTLCIIPVSSLPAMVRAGDAGDRNAREMFMTITNWMNTADKAIDDNVFPGCAYCRAELHHGEVFGWAVLTPASEGVGMVAAYCQDCMAREHDELMREFITALEADTGVITAMLQ